MRHYLVSHRIGCAMAPGLAQSHHLLHLTPRTQSRQTVIRATLMIEPASASLTELICDFGNAAVIVRIEREDGALRIEARSEVDLHEGLPPDPSRGSSWDDVAAQLRGNLGAETFEAVPYSCPSSLIRPSAGIYRYARASFPEGRPLLEAAAHLIGRIHREIACDAEANAELPVEEILRNKSGAARDLAHLAIACLRSHGLAARLVSGYLVHGATASTESESPGRRHADAWLAVWAPEAGWVDFDPARNAMAGAGYIALAAGRDWQDVMPVRGALADGRAPRYESEIAVTPAPEN